MDTLFRITDVQLDHAVDVLVRAFFDDPMFVHYTPDPRARKRVMDAIFRSGVRFGLQHGEIWATSPKLEAVAVWYAPGHTDPPLSSFLSLEMLAAIPALLSGGVGRLVETIRFQNTVLELHSQDVTEAHWYLYAIGTAPEFQGKGYGSALLRPMLARMDAQKLPCYLETQTAPNVAFYQKRGFRVLREAHQPGTDLRIWTMLRPPAYGGHTLASLPGQSLQ